MITTKSNWNKLFKFIFVKVSYSYITILLLFLSLFITLISVITFFWLNLPVNQFLNKFQYFILIFYAIFSFIFILFVAIKIFGTQFKDNFFLLLITKPYSRRTIVLTQYLVLLILSFLFITFNIVTLLVWGGIIGTIVKVSYLSFYVLTILKLFAFLLLLSLLMITSSVTLLTFKTSQIIFLILIISSSLLAIGALPTVVINSSGTSNLQLQFANGLGTYSVNEVENSILFNKYYKTDKLKYANLTKAVATFENNLSVTDLENYNSIDVINKRINFFKSRDLMMNTSKIIPPMSGVITSWPTNPSFNNKNVTINLAFNDYFYNPKELQTNINLDPNNQYNPIKKDLLQLEQDYEKEFTIDKFMQQEKFKAPQLLSYDQSQCDISINGAAQQQLPTDQITAAFLDANNYKLSSGLRTALEAAFYNPTYFLIRTVEDYIYHQVLVSKKLNDTPIVKDANFKKFSNITTAATAVSYINVIGQWSHLWNFFVGNYQGYWFNPLDESSISFDNNENSNDFYFKVKSNGTIDFSEIKSTYNNVINIIIYVVIIVILFIISYLLFMRKIID